MSDNKPLFVALLVVGALLVGGLVFWIAGGSRSDTVTESVAIPAPPMHVVTPPPLPESEPDTDSVAAIPAAEPEVDLPSLDDSDQLVRDGIVNLTRDEGIHGWLGSGELIRKAVVLVDNVANGSIPRQQVAFLAPVGPFIATQVADDVYVMSEASFQRYDKVTAIFVSIDSRRAAEFFVLIKPLFQHAYDELGYPNRKFDEVIFQAIGRLLETPVMTSPIRLVRPVVTYEYEDPRLESLSAAQKQLLRMGPKNTRLIQTKLGEIAIELRSILKK
jgi:hypothetical protein